MTVETDVGAGRHFHARQDERQFRWVYAIIFTIYFVLAVASRLVPWRRKARADESHKSITDEARARASRMVPFFFMG